MQNREKFPAEFWGSGFSKWVEIFESSFRLLATGRGGRPSVSTLALAALNGLLHDFLATGDRKRITAALLVLIEKMSDNPLERQDDLPARVSRRASLQRCHELVDRKCTVDRNLERS